MKVIVGTSNKKKVTAVTKVFKDVFKLSQIEAVACPADSKVPDAPHDEETYQGALNRAKDCQTQGLADYFVGIESGLVERYGNLFEEAWAVVISEDGHIFIGYSSGLLLPPVVAERMRNGEKHDDIMADYDKILNSPEDSKDTWSRYTGGNISRQVSLDEALRNALIQLMPSQKNLYTRS